MFFKTCNLFIFFPQFYSRKWWILRKPRTILAKGENGSSRNFEHSVILPLDAKRIAMREIELVDPFCSDRPVIGRLDHHVETRNRRKPAGTSMAAWCFAYPFCPATREMSVIFPLYLFRARLNRYALSYPANVVLPLLFLRFDISRNWQRFCRSRFASAASRCYFAFAAENCSTQKLAPID